jgi:hypothetical protein
VLVVLVAGFFAVFLVVVWRVSAGPSNEEPAIGNNLPGPSAEWGQFGLVPTLQDRRWARRKALSQSIPTLGSGLLVTASKRTTSRCRSRDEVTWPSRPPT